jgi:hypothetical protein
MTWQCLFDKSPISNCRYPCDATRVMTFVGITFRNRSRFRCGAASLHMGNAHEQILTAEPTRNTPTANDYSCFLMIYIARRAAMQKGRAVAPFTQVLMHGSPYGARNRLAHLRTTNPVSRSRRCFSFWQGRLGGMNQGTHPQIIHAQRQRQRQPRPRHHTRPLTTASSCACITTSYRYRYPHNAPSSAALPYNLRAHIHSASSAPSSRHDPISHAITRLDDDASAHTLSIAPVFLCVDLPCAYHLLRWAPLASIAPHLGLARLDSADTVKGTPEHCAHGGI